MEAKFKPVVYETAEKASEGGHKAEPYNGGFISVRENGNDVWCYDGDYKDWIPRSMIERRIDERRQGDRRIKQTETTTTEWEQNSDRYRP